MPNLKSAKKKMRQDVKRKLRNKNYSKQIDDIMNDMRKNKKKNKEDVVSKAHSLIDKAAKKHIIHANKADRLKGRVSRLIAKK